LVTYDEAVGAPCEGSQGKEVQICRELFDALGEAVLLFDQNGRISCANAAAWQMFAGSESNGGVHDNHAERVFPETPELSSFLEGPWPREEDVILRRDSGRRVLRVKAGLLGSGGQRPPTIAIVALDVGEQGVNREALAVSVKELAAKNAQLEELIQKLKQTQNQLMQSEKMASIGQLAAGVAHEINNPVGYVYSNIGTLERYLKDIFLLLDAYRRAELSVELDGCSSANEISQIQEEIDLPFLRKDVGALISECREGINRVKKIVQDLRDFSRAGMEDVWEFADLHKGLDSTLNVVWSELKYKCELRKEYGELPVVECLPSQLNQVFMNLLVNAAQAIPDKGTVTIRTGRVDREVWIEIADTGSGIRPEHRARLFEPFFTTKAPGQGTGLGLPVSYGIVERHGGHIEVESEPGKGATFRIWLPVIQPDKTAQ